jgi:hypothetical protein
LLTYLLSKGFFVQSGSTLNPQGLTDLEITNTGSNYNMNFDFSNGDSSEEAYTTFSNTGSPNTIAIFSNTNDSMSFTRTSATSSLVQLVRQTIPSETTVWNLLLD